MSDFNIIILEPILIVLGLVAFAMWQFRDLRKAREETQRRKLQEAERQRQRQRWDDGDRGGAPPAAPR
ncbi:MAG: hypothetical protein ACKOCJ_10685 [Burkholderiaceae bacterium]